MSNDMTVAMVRAPSLASDTSRVHLSGSSAATEAAGARQVVSVDGKNSPPASQPVAVNDAELDQAVSRMNEFVQSMRRDLSFSVDKESGQVVIKVLDSSTKEVIRQFPAEEALKMAQNLKDLYDKGEGMIFQDRA